MLSPSSSSSSSAPFLQQSTTVASPISTPHPPSTTLTFSLSTPNLSNASVVPFNATIRLLSLPFSCTSCTLVLTLPTHLTTHFARTKSPVVFTAIPSVVPLPTHTSSLLLEDLLAVVPNLHDHFARYEEVDRDTYDWFLKVEMPRAVPHTKPEKGEFNEQRPTEKEGERGAYSPLRKQEEGRVGKRKR